MAKALKELLDERAGYVVEARKLLDTAQAEKRELNSAESDSYNKIDAQIDRLSGEIHARELATSRASKLAALEGQIESGQQLGRQTAPSEPGSGRGEALSIQWRGKEFRLASNTPEHARGQDDYRQKFLRYATHGENLGLQVSNDTKGGYLTPPQMAAAMIKFLDDEVFIRRIATVHPPLMQALSLGIPSWETDPGDADWTAEVPASAISEDDAARVGKRELMPHLLTKLVKMSTKMLRSSIIDIESYVVQRLGYKFAITEEKAFLTGTGAQKPLGVFTASDNGIPTSRDVTASATTSFTFDDLINVQMSLKGGYHSRASWVMHRDVVKMVRKLKTGDGQYLWQPAVTQGQPNLILNRPYYMSEHAPSTFTTGLYLAIFGDFSFFHIVDSLAMEVQRLNELYSLTNQVGLVGRKETDGMPVLSEAFARLKLA